MFRCFNQKFSVVKEYSLLRIILFMSVSVVVVLFDLFVVDESIVVVRNFEISFLSFVARLSVANFKKGVYCHTKFK